MITFEQACATAGELKQLSPRIRGTDLFGSVVHRGSGRDADFAVLVDDRLAARWWDEEREAIRVRWPDALYPLRWVVKTFAPFVYEVTIRKRKRQRLVAAANILAVDIGSLVVNRGQHLDVELFLLPEDWRVDHTLNANAVRRVTNLVDDQNTRGFFNRIAKDAVRI